MILCQTYFFIKITAALNFPHVLCYFTLCVYLYPCFLPLPIQCIGHTVSIFVVCQPRPIINKLMKCAILRILWIYARNIPFMGVYQDVWCGKAHSSINDCIYIVEYKIQNTNYNDENTRIWLFTKKCLDRPPWRVCFEQQKTSLIKRKIYNSFPYKFL